VPSGHQKVDNVFVKAEIRPSAIDREGVFALEPIAKGKVLSIWRNITIHTEDEYNTRAGDKAFRRNAVRVVGGYYGYQEGGTIPEDFINHSSDRPNVHYHMGVLFALRDIRPGEELLLDYNFYFNLREGFLDVTSGRQVTGLTPRECLLRSCQILTDLLSDPDLADWDGT